MRVSLIFRSEYENESDLLLEDRGVDLGLQEPSSLPHQSPLLCRARGLMQRSTVLLSDFPEHSADPSI